GRTPKVYLDGVLRGGGARGGCQRGEGAGWFGEVDSAALEEVTVSGEDKVPAAEVHAPQNHRLGRGSTHMQVSAALQAELAAGEVEPVGRIDADVQPQILREAAGGWRRGFASELSHK